ncbi:hypothetical protein SARC_13799, partial [Sphaeroforma arctica JP610]
MTLDLFVKLYGLLNLRSDIKAVAEKSATIYKNSTAGQSQKKMQVYMETFEFVQFLKSVQCVPDATLAMARSIINKYEDDVRNLELGRLSVSGLTLYLQAPENWLVNDNQDTVHQNMNQPLAAYWHNTSHNTYVSNHQLKGLSTVDMYEKVLLTGCRCIELDCWDGDSGEPIIHHGYTLISKISFEDVVVCIREYAFLASPYPLVLSIENHCCIAQQRRMAEIMRNIFGDYLMTDYLPTVQ